MKNKIMLMSLVVLLAAALVGGATVAWFTDTAANAPVTLTTGTLDLRVNGLDQVTGVKIDNMQPGDVSGYHKWVLRNNGSLPGRLSVTFSEIINHENCVVGPEIEAEYQPYASPEGELGQYLTTGVHPDDMCPEALRYVTFIERNDLEGWYIAEVSREVDTGGSIGWGPSGWTVPSRLFGQWQAGPPHPWGIPGLNFHGGRTHNTLGFLPGDILMPGQEVAFFFRASLADTLRRWDGTKWLAVNNNIIQSDSAEFTLTFGLAQVGSP